MDRHGSSMAVPGTTRPRSDAGRPRCSAIHPSTPGTRRRRYITDGSPAARRPEQHDREQSTVREWFFDTGASLHMSPGFGNISSLSPHSSSTQIIVGNGTYLPVTHTGNSSIPTNANPLSLNNILVSPSLIKNLISVRALTRDNPVNIEFDASGFSIKDRRTKAVILRSDSTGDLYPLKLPSSSSTQCFTALSADLWHQRLGHPGTESFRHLLRSYNFSCNKDLTHTCHACRTGKHVRLPFSTSQHSTTEPFAIIHCDVWTSPIASFTGLQYYLVLLDDYTHFVWTFPLRHKSEVAKHIIAFHAFVRTQFGLSIRAFQTDNGGEFDNHILRQFYTHQGITL